jgi:hypothetical protein
MRSRVATRQRKRGWRAKLPLSRRQWKRVSQLPDIARSERSCRCTSELSHHSPPSGISNYVAGLLREFARQPAATRPQ